MQFNRVFKMQFNQEAQFKKKKLYQNTYKLESKWLHCTKKIWNSNSIRILLAEWICFSTAY